MFLRLSPLVGGPKFLRVHTALFVEDDNELVGFDFLPREPTDPETLRKLVTMQTCPGQVRELRSVLDDTFLPLGNSSLTMEQT